MRIVECYPLRMKIFAGRGFWALFTPLRFALSLLYGAAVELRGRRGRRVKGGPHPARVPRTVRARVVSIGNLEVGGGGKTPCAMELAGAIAERGGRAVVVMRGYRSDVDRRRLIPFVVPSGHVLHRAGEIAFHTEASAGDVGTSAESQAAGAALARLIGDEAVLYRSRGVPVVIDRDRSRGVRVADRLFEPSHIILDDAFQNIGVHRDVDILLLDARRPFGDGRLMPYGTLRERPASAARAHAVLFTRARAAEAPPDTAEILAGIPLFFAVHRAVDLETTSGDRKGLSSIDGERVVLFSGIARPESFEALAVGAGAQPLVSFRFVDHHRYRRRDIERMIAASSGAPFLTTEKDLAKAAALFPATAKVCALRIGMEIAELGSLVELVWG